VGLVEPAQAVAPEGELSEATSRAVPRLEVVEVSKRFGVVQALDRVSLAVERGEVHALVGENGAGKSTLTRIIGGAEKADSGQIRFEGAAVNLSSPAAALSAGVGVVYQHLNLSVELTVAGNLFLGREPRRRLGGVDDRTMNGRAVKLLQRLGATFPPEALVGELSSSDRQLAEIARALSNEPTLLIMDEPTAALAPQNAERVFQVVKEIKAQGVSVVYITHELAHVFELADRVTVLKDGQRTMTREVASTEREEVIRAMVGRTVSTLFPARENPLDGEAAPALELRGLTLPGHFEDVALGVRPGEIVGLGGLVGSGRSSLAQAIFGVLPERRTGPLSGEIMINGKRVRIRSPHVAVAHGIGFVPEDRKAAGLVLSTSVASNIALPQLERLAHAGVLSARAEARLAREQVEALKIKTPSLDTEVAYLSGGNQQKVVLSKWLACGCSILILDEPTPGVDVGAKAEIYALIRRIASRGTAVLLISSDLPELIGLSDRVFVMSRGRIVAEQEQSSATEESIIRAAFDGIDAQV
jgi:rhamnose transport system ATP-binding protein